MMTQKVSLDFQTISARLKSVAMPDVDCVVGIASGGTVPAALVAFQLGKPLYLLSVNYRAPDNSPRRSQPRVLNSAEIPPSTRHVLLVDDVSVSGKTLAAAKAHLPSVQHTTLVMKGSADIVLFPEVAACVNWPWQNEAQQHAVLVVMGVSGSGKTTVGKLLAERLEVPFYDADDFHPQRNIDKMRAGTPLTDADRVPWLDRLHAHIRLHVQANEAAVITCSALKQSYRARLRGPLNAVHFVHLDGDFDRIWQRMRSREGHYMRASMLQSQFDALEPPSAAEALIVSIEQTPEQIVEEILKRLS